MGKKTYLINGRYYLLDDEMGDVKEIIVKDGPEIPEEMKQLIKAIITDIKQ